MWELAPGSPWKTTRFFANNSLPTQLAAEHGARPLQILRRVDAERHLVDERHVDPHAGFQRPQLLQLLALLKRARRQRDEALQRRAAIGIDAAVMIERPLAPGRGGAGEIERAEPPRRDRRCRPPSRRSGCCARARARSRRRAWRSRRPASLSGPSAAAMAAGERVGKSPCTLTTTSWRRSGIELSERLEDAVGAGGMVGARQHAVRAGAVRARRRSSSESAATATGPIPAASARSTTRAIIGRPPISASGLFGRRVAARRAGMTTIGFMARRRRRRIGGKRSQETAAYTA